MSDSHRITLPAPGVTPVPIAGEAVTGSSSSEVSSPFDGARLGEVPLLGDAEVERAVAAATTALPTSRCRHGGGRRSSTRRHAAA